VSKPSEAASTTRQKSGISIFIFVNTAICEGWPSAASSSP
jgi:hypothetical protein